MASARARHGNGMDSSQQRGAGPRQRHDAATSPPRRRRARLVHRRRAAKGARLGRVLEMAHVHAPRQDVWQAGAACGGAAVYGRHVCRRSWARGRGSGALLFHGHDRAVRLPAL
eukprot:6186158-Pleurochrysis_carterae.AAC.1